jgi:hypothetical protein
MNALTLALPAERTSIATKYFGNDTYLAGGLASRHPYGLDAQSGFASVRSHTVIDILASWRSITDVLAPSQHPVNAQAYSASKLGAQPRSRWVQIASLGCGSLSLAQVGELVEALSLALHEGRFGEIDSSLNLLTPSRMSSDAITAVARVTYPARERLRYWLQFARQAKIEFAKREKRFLFGEV